MFKYTPEPTFLETFRRAEKRYKTYELLKEHFHQYSIICVFWRGYEGTCYFSKEKLREVPVNGIMFPVKYFKEEET